MKVIVLLNCCFSCCICAVVVMTNGFALFMTNYCKGTSLALVTQLDAHLTGDQEVAGSTGLVTFFCGDYHEIFS